MSLPPAFVDTEGAVRRLPPETMLPAPGRAPRSSGLGRGDAPAQPARRPDDAGTCARQPQSEPSSRRSAEAARRRLLPWQSRRRPLVCVSRGLSPRSMEVTWFASEERVTQSRSVPGSRRRRFRSARTAYCATFGDQPTPLRPPDRHHPPRGGAHGGRTRAPGCGGDDRPTHRDSPGRGPRARGRDRCDGELRLGRSHQRQRCHGPHQGLT